MQKEITSIGSINVVIFDLGKVLIRASSRKILFKFNTLSLIQAICLERRKLNELKSLLFSIMEIKHGKGKYTSHQPALFEDWMTNQRSNQEILTILLKNIQEYAYISRHTRQLLTDLANIIFSPNKFAEIMELHSGAKLLHMLPKNMDKYLITNYNSECYDEIEQRFPDMFSNFNDILVSGKVSLMKPQNEIYELAIKKWNLNPEKVLYIDDDIFNIQTAKNIGFQTIHYDKFENVISKIRSLDLKSCRSNHRDKHAYKSY
jgi:HAD superfamily hydrolase (TIGR01549 family)